ncbi:MAG: T9SS C-terminal target domain-containing protein, partial [Rhodothermales bacterium]|nr:T9SS C-terminal target domain-containing protein [Rhodothermales bacterium]
TGDVRLGVYNLLGEEVARLADGIVEAGTHAVVWTAEGLPGGVYMIRLSTAGSSVARPVTLVR